MGVEAKFHSDPYLTRPLFYASHRSELGAFFARKYGLTHDELRYILDPADAKGADYPSETFRVLKSKEEARYHEYCTGRLVLDAWDRLAVTNIGTNPIAGAPRIAGPRGGVD